MHLCVFSNVYGNLDALGRVLEAIEDCHPDLIICGGDLVGTGANSNEVVEEIRRLRIPALMGDWDFAAGYELSQGIRGEGESRRAKSNEESWEQAIRTISGENKRYLRGLIGQMVFQAYGKNIMIAHGNSRSHGTNRLFSGEEDLTSGIRLNERWDLLILGQALAPEVRQLSERMVAHSGSVSSSGSDAQGAFVEVMVGANCIKPTIHRVELGVTGIPKSVESGQWKEPWSSPAVNSSEFSGDGCRY